MPECLECNHPGNPATNRSHTNNNNRQTTKKLLERKLGIDIDIDVELLCGYLFHQDIYIYIDTYIYLHRFPSPFYYLELLFFAVVVVYYCCFYYLR